MKHLNVKMCMILMVSLLAIGGTRASAQTTSTLIVSDTSQAAWFPSPSNDLTFGTPAVPVLTSYIGEFFLKANVVNGVPSGTPAITKDFGKPAVVGGSQLSPPLKPMIVVGTEYYLFLSATGPGGTSVRSAPVGPFGFPPAPTGVTSAVTITK